MYCVKCGQQLPSEANFCPSCGVPVHRPENSIIGSTSSAVVAPPNEAVIVSTLKLKSVDAGFATMARADLKPEKDDSEQRAGRIKISRIARDSAIVVGIFALGRFAVFNFAPSVLKNPDYAAIAAASLLSGGFFVSGVLTRESRWKHLWLVALSVWLAGVVASAFGVGDLKTSLLLGPIAVSMVMAVGGGIATLLTKAPPAPPESREKMDVSTRGYYFGTLLQYAKFTGRASRAEFWWFWLFNVVLVPCLLAFLEAIFQSVTRQPILPAGSVLASCYSLLTMIPMLAVGVRRMHDTDRSGWWLLLPFANLIFALTAGDNGSNDYGPGPAM